MKRGSWKRVEGKVAARFGTERTPLSGGNSKITRSDTLSKDKYIEVKCRKTWAVFTLFRDTAKKAKKEKKMPMLVLHETGTHLYLKVEKMDIKRLPEVKDE